MYFHPVDCSYAPRPPFPVRCSYVTQPEHLEDPHAPQSVGNPCCKGAGLKVPIRDPGSVESPGVLGVCQSGVQKTMWSTPLRPAPCGPPPAWPWAKLTLGCFSVAVASWNWTHRSDLFWKKDHACPLTHWRQATFLGQAKAVEPARAQSIWGRSEPLGWEATAPARPATVLLVYLSWDLGREEEEPPLGCSAWLSLPSRPPLAPFAVPILLSWPLSLAVVGLPAYRTFVCPLLLFPTQTPIYPACQPFFPILLSCSLSPEQARQGGDCHSLGQAGSEGDFPSTSFSHFKS